MENVKEFIQLGVTAYLLDDNDLFDEIAFRVMNSQNDNQLICCHKLKYNGKIKFVYFTDGMKPLSDLRPVDAENQISQLVNKVEESGFLNIACLDMRESHIYVDEQMKIHLIYVPIESKSIVRKEEIVGMTQNKKEENMMCWVLEGITRNCEYIIDGNVTIGKSESKADVAISGNTAISRIHCEFRVDEGRNCYICDLRSSNGTYVNEMRLQPEQWVNVETDTKIRIANEEFVLRRK